MYVYVTGCWAEGDIRVMGSYPRRALRKYGYRDSQWGEMYDRERKFFIESLL